MVSLETRISLQRSKQLETRDVRDIPPELVISGLHCICNLL